MNAPPLSPPRVLLRRIWTSPWWVPYYVVVTLLVVAAWPVPWYLVAMLVLSWAIVAVGQRLRRRDLGRGRS